MKLKLFKHSINRITGLLVYRLLSSIGLSLFTLIGIDKLIAKIISDPSIIKYDENVD